MVARLDRDDAADERRDDDRERDRIDPDAPHLANRLRYEGRRIAERPHHVAQEVAANADLPEETDEVLRDVAQEPNALSLDDGERLRAPLVSERPVEFTHVRTRTSNTSPRTAKAAFGSHAATSGDTNPPFPTAFVS